MEKNRFSHFQKVIKSPVGALTLIAAYGNLVAILWEKERSGRVRLPALQPGPQHPILCEAEKQLREYFSGQRVAFQLPLAPQGSPFQVEVWRALQAIPFGQTRSYRDLAQELGRPRACRAVGSANGRNPLSIVIPCHRVIGANGQLSGFAGGLEVKAFLLDHEKRSF